MNNAYSTILKVDRMQAEKGNGASILMESENDRSTVVFAHAFQRLQNLAQTFSHGACHIERSRLTNALQTAQLGRRIAAQIAVQLEGTRQASRNDCAALINTIETACLIRDIGAPPFGQAGEAAIRSWFGERGPEKIRSACQPSGTRTLDASDPRVQNALSDFTEFDRNPQGLRVLAKLHWNNQRHGLNLNKACLAAVMQYLRICGGHPNEQGGNAVDRPGFFSTEAGLVKNIWSTFGYEATPQRFPLNYVVEAAAQIASALGDLEETFDAELSSHREAAGAIKDVWLSTYIPADPDPADEQIMNLLTDAAAGKNEAGNDFSFADLRRGLIETICDYTARQYLDQHASIFSGTLTSLFLPESGSAALLAAIHTHCLHHQHRHPHLRDEELRCYALIHGLLDRFGTLLDLPGDRFQSDMRDCSGSEEPGISHYQECKLLGLIPDAYRSAYALLVTQIGDGRDAAFEEWNARAHLVVDYIAGLTESAAVALLNTLTGH